MKIPSLNIFAILVTATLTFSGCGSAQSGAAGAHGAKTGDQTTRLHVGMTKAQVVRAWGEPSRKGVTEHGESWYWGSQNLIRAIPLVGPFINVQTSYAEFGSNGLLKSYNYQDSKIAGKIGS